MKSSACDKCLRVLNAVKRYNLTREGHGAGSIDLCDPCWEQTAKRNMKPGRARNGVTIRRST